MFDTALYAIGVLFYIELILIGIAIAFAIIIYTFVGIGVVVKWIYGQLFK